MTLDTDLATLRQAILEYAFQGTNPFNATESEDALRRVEAELARLREERDALLKAVDGMARAPYGEFEKNYLRAEAAERELARLQEGLRQILEVPEYLRSSDVLGAQAIARALLAEDTA